jgi:crotonobetainyl-CoA:carnitine CoA-transferase CaiB-like acyl-CoA transferase
MQPFSSIKVVDLTHVIAGPFCTFQLAVMGANVIKVESPSLPDMVRATGIDFPKGEAGLSFGFVSQNSNKKAVAIDLKTEEGKQILRELCKGADIFVENYRSGAMAELGFDYESVKSIQPDIIYCSMTGYGQDGPLGKRTAYDNVIQAFSGLMGATGSDETGPMKVGPPVLDYGTGIQAAYAIAAALFQRTKTQQGQYIDIAMLDSALMLMSSNITHYQQNGKLHPTTGNMSSFNAGYGCYPTADGLLMIGAYTSKQVSDMWEVLGDSEHAKEFIGLQSSAMSDFLVADTEKLHEVLLAKTASEWEILFNEHKVPAARVRQVDETLADPHLQCRTVMQSAGNSASSATYPTASFKYAQGGGPVLHSDPPVLGQHTHEVLTDLGYNAQQIKDLADKNIVSLNN